MTTLPFQEQVGFDRQRDAIDYSYQTGRARNAAATSQLDLDQGLAVRRLERDFGRARQQLPGSYAGRGLLNSGFYKRGLQDFGTSQVDALSALENDFGSRRNDLFGQLSSLDANRLIQLADVDLNQATRRSAIASVLQGVG